MSLSRSGYCAPKGAQVSLRDAYYKHFAPDGAKTYAAITAFCLLTTAFCLEPR